MKYLRVKFDANNGISTMDFRQTCYDIVASLAGGCGFESFEEEGDLLVGYIQEDLFDKEQLDALLDSFPIENVNVSYSIEKADYQDWNKEWEEAGFDPIVVDGLCVIHDTKHVEPVSNGMMDVLVDAKMAFGSGTHATTRMIVSNLLGRDLRGKRVLDCGCGTGILSIVASKHGAESVVAYDIDEWSVENTKHNAQLNGVENIDVLLGDINVLSHVSGVFDVIVANINRNILLTDMPTMKGVMAENGKLIISGFYKEDVALLKERASELGLQMESMKELANWVSLSFSS